jgi:hypothetical protein
MYYLRYLSCIIFLLTNMPMNSFFYLFLIKLINDYEFNLNVFILFYLCFIYSAAKFTLFHVNSREFTLFHTFSRDFT